MSSARATYTYLVWPPDFLERFHAETLHELPEFAGEFVPREAIVWFNGNGGRLPETVKSESLSHVYSVDGRLVGFRCPVEDPAGHGDGMGR